MISSTFFHLVSYSLPIGIMLVMCKCNAKRWNRLAQAYRADKKIDSAANIKMQTVILVSGTIGWNSYKGVATVGVTKEGIWFQLMPPFSLFHPPLLIPFNDCQIEPRKWYLVGETFQYTFRGGNGVKMIIHDDTQDWIESQVAHLASTQQAMPSHEELPAGMTTAH